MRSMRTDWRAGWAPGIGGRGTAVPLCRSAQPMMGMTSRSMPEDEAYLHEVLRTGAAEASTVADETLAKARKAMGFLDLGDIQ